MRQKLSKGGVFACTRESLLALRWKDKSDVLMLSTKHTSSMEAVSVRASGGCVVKNKPTVVQEYNHYMSGVDVSRQKLQNYHLNRKTV